MRRPECDGFGHDSDLDSPVIFADWRLTLAQGNTRYLCTQHYDEWIRLYLRDRRLRPTDVDEWTEARMFHWRNRWRVPLHGSLDYAGLPRLDQLGHIA
jgi:hypothetical protein